MTRLRIRKSSPPSTRVSQRFESDALARLRRLGVTDQRARALISRSFAAVVAGDTEDLDDALDTAIANAGGALADAWQLDINRAGAVDLLDQTLPEPQVNHAKADPQAQSDALELKIKQVAAMSAMQKAHPDLSEAQALTRVLKANPKLYGASTSSTPELVAGEGTLADLLDGKLDQVLQARLAKGEHIGTASRGIFRDNDDLRELAELVRNHEADAKFPIDIATARLRKARPDVDIVRLVKRSGVLDEAVIVAVAKRRSVR